MLLHCLQLAYTHTAAWLQPLQWKSCLVVRPAGRPLSILGPLCCCSLMHLCTSLPKHASCLLHTLPTCHNRRVVYLLDTCICSSNVRSAKHGRCGDGTGIRIGSLIAGRDHCRQPLLVFNVPLGAADQGESFDMHSHAGTFRTVSSMLVRQQLEAWDLEGLSKCKESAC